VAADEDEPVVVRAVMGAGKSVLIAELCALAEVDGDDVLVVSCPTRDLVRQLAKTIGERIGASHVGQFYTSSKDVTQRVIVVCMPSMAALHKALAASGRRCSLWIADECHRTESVTAIDAKELIRPRQMIGFTATPYRSETGKGLSLYDREVYSYGVAEAVRDAVVVPWRVVSWTGGHVAMDEACVDMCRRGTQIGPGVVNALTIDDATTFAEILRESGLRAAPVHSNLSARQVACRIDSLERGELEVVVHVSMLKEGIDMPWLRWMCLRRPVSSRVRFAQEVGRCLRAFGGKSEAVIYDPNDLFGTFKLSYDAVLGGDFEPELDEDAQPSKKADVWAMQLELWLRSALAGEWVSPLTDVAAYLREMTCALEMSGAVERFVAPKQWRDRQMTDKQKGLLSRIFKSLKPTHVRRVPAVHRKALKAACHCAVRHEMSRGQASDLIGTLIAIRKHRGWPDMSSTT